MRWLHHTGVGSPNATKSSSENIFGNMNARIDMRTPIIAGKNIVIAGICLNPNSPSKHRTWTPVYISVFFLPSKLRGLLSGSRRLSANASVILFKNEFPVISFLPKNKNTPDTTGMGIVLMTGNSMTVEASSACMMNPVNLVSVTFTISISLVSWFNLVSDIART